jgi:predicted dehydrogenase
MTTRIALVGLGQPTAETYLRCLRQMPQVLVAAVVEPGFRLPAEQGEGLQGVATFPHHRNLLKQFPVDGAVICQSSGGRKATVVDCARAGKSILCESPISETLVEAREMWAISQAHDVLFGVCFPIRLSSACSQVRQRILEGGLGRLLTVHLRKSDGCAGFSSREVFGGAGGLWTNPGASLVDSLRWLLGGEFTLVTVMDPGDGSDNRSGWLRLEMNHGVAVTVESSLMDPLVGVKMPEAVCLEISGARGRLNLELFPGADSVGFDPGCDRPEESPIRRMLANFVEAVQGRTRIAAGGMDGLRAVEVVEAARRALKYRTAVAL